MKFTCSLYTKNIIEEEMEVIKKALVISHDYYASRGKYDDALEITDLLAGDQDDEGCFKFTAQNEHSDKYPLHQNIEKEIQNASWFQLDDVLGQIVRGWNL